MNGRIKCPVARWRCCGIGTNGGTHPGKKGLVKGHKAGGVKLPLQTVSIAHIGERFRVETIICDRRAINLKVQCASIDATKVNCDSLQKKGG